MEAKHFTLFILLFCFISLFGQDYQYARPKSNSRVLSSGNLTQYWTLDTTKVFKVYIHLNSVSLIQFPARVKLAVAGNTAEIKTRVEDNSVYVKPLLGATHSNLQVTLYSGEIVTIELHTKKHGKRNERTVFFYPDHNPIRDLTSNLSMAFADKAKFELENLRHELRNSIPEESVKDLLVYRISGSRKSTSLKYQGYRVGLESVLSTRRYTYFVFNTNAKPKERCPVFSIKKIEVKSSKQSKAPLDLDEFFNTGNRIIMRTSSLGEKYEKMKLFISISFYGKIKTLKAVVY